MNPEIESVIELLFVIIFLFFAVLFFIAFVMNVYAFFQELDYINQEIRRTTGEAQRWWKQEKCRLWLSLLPFYRG